MESCVSEDALPWVAAGAVWPVGGPSVSPAASVPALLGTRQPSECPALRGPVPTQGLLSQQQLKQQRDKLKQYQKRITQQLEREREIARQLLRDGRKE